MNENKKLNQGINENNNNASNNEKLSDIDIKTIIDKIANKNFGADKIDNKNCIYILAELVKGAKKYNGKTYALIEEVDDGFLKKLGEVLEGEYSSEKITASKVSFYLNNLIFSQFSPVPKDEQDNSNKSWNLVIQFYKLKERFFSESSINNKEIEKEFIEKETEEGKYIIDDGRNIEIRELKNKLHDLSNIVQICAKASCDWFNNLVYAASKSAKPLNDKEGHKKAQITLSSKLQSYLWYKIPMYYKENPISLSIFFNANIDKKIIVTIEIHDNIAEKNHLSKFYNKKVNELKELVFNGEYLEKEDKNKLKYFVHNGEEASYAEENSNNINKLEQLKNEQLDNSKRVRVFYTVDLDKDNEIINGIVEGINLLYKCCEKVSYSNIFEREIYKTIYSRRMKQLVLTGAPGTGKTYGAREYVKSLTEEDERKSEIIQFHPSYDYTDFVEGIRPIKTDKDDPIFVKMDGTFKAFCRRVVDDDLQILLNILDEKGADDKYSDFNDNDDINEYYKKKLEEIAEEKQDNEESSSADLKKFVVKKYLENKIEGAKNKEENKKEVIFYTVRDIAKKKDSEKEKEYPTDVELELLNMFNSSEGEYEDYRFFIIDEINRADISKVLGELMYGLEYRGVQNQFPTQYAQLEEVYKKNEETEKYEPLPFDCFKDGFFIPENVIIIGTMNDIDRSVESFDFAMRRRFHWIKIKTDDVMKDVLQGILKKKTDGIDKELADKIKKKIDRTVNAIKEMNRTLKDEGKRFGLNEDYQIGPSYFSNIASNGDIDDKTLETEFDLKIEPTLREYLRGRNANVDTFISNCRTALLNKFKEKSKNESTEKAEN